MSDYDIPELPSDEELGITEEDRKAFEEQQSGSSSSPATATGEAPARGGGSDDQGPGGPAKAPPGTGDAPRAPAGTPPGDAGRRGPLMLLLLLAVGLFSASWARLPSPVPANAPAEEFSSARAMSNLVEIARAPHPPGSPEHDRVRRFLVDRLEQLDFETSVQTTTSVRRFGSTVRAATVRNVIGRRPGMASTGAVLVTAHYDSRGLSRGAGDDGVGVVAILEAVRALATENPLRNDLIVLLTDAEELGLLGAHAFVDQHPWMEDVATVVSVEMRGGGGASIMFETGEDDGWIVQRLAEVDPAPVANSLANEVYRRMPNDTDFTPFRDAGVQGLNFAAIGRPNVYHQAYDEPANISEATIQHHGIRVLAVLEALGNADLAEVDAPSRVYFALPLLGLITYDQRWVVPIGILVLFGTIGVVLLARSRGARISGMLVGLGLAVVAGGVAWAVGSFAFAWLSASHPELGALHGSAFHEEGWYVASFVALLFGLVTGFFGLARRFFTLGELAVGAVLLPAVAALAASALAPMAAMNVQWPVLAALGAIAVVAGVGRRMVPGWIGWLVTLLLAVPVLVLMVPLVELVWLSMTLRLAGVLGFLIVTGLLLLLPALDSVRAPNAWWAPALGVTLSALLLGGGLLFAGPDDRRPAPSTLLYGLDRESGRGVWITSAARGDDDPARTWAESKAGTTFSDSVDVTALGVGAGQRPAGPGPVAAAAAPQVAVASVNLVGGEPLDDAAPAEGSARPLRVHVALRSSIGAEAMMVRFPADAGVRLVAVNGRPVPPAAGGADGPEATTLVHYGRPEPFVRLELETAPGRDAVEFDVVEHLLRPEELVGAGTFERPPGLAPDITTLSDRAVLRTPVRLPLARGATNELWPGPPFDPEELHAEPDTGRIAAPDVATGEAGPGTPADTMRGPGGASPPTGAGPAGVDSLPGAPTARPDTGTAPAAGADTVRARPDTAASPVAGPVRAPS